MAKPEPGKPLIQIKLSREIIKQLDYLAIEWEQHRYQVIERLLTEKLREFQLPPLAS